MDKELKQKVFQWDVESWSSVMSNWKTSIEKVNSLNCLAFGEREGGLSLWLALNGHNVICTDYNKFDITPLPLHEKENVGSKISYQNVDITATSFYDNSFDLIVFKSVVGALGSKELQTKAFSEIHRILKPGGKLLFAENICATKVHQYARRKFTNWGERWYYPSLAEIKEYTSAFKTFEFQTGGFFGTFGRSEKQRSFLQKIDRPLNKITPKHWRYIVSGIAIK